MKILLMGNPNVGKSVVFNRLTGVNVIASNYPGTTVAFTKGTMRLGENTADVIDVPGTYTLEPTSRAEEVAVKMVDEMADDDVIVNVVDATNLERSLNLTLQLLKRYTSGTRYRLVGTRDPSQALDLAARLGPRIIVLDVMMPQMDGWKVLGLLRQHPLTRDLSIVVCTILGQEDLALALGASAFLKKPVRQQVFQSALDTQMQQGVAASH